MGYYIWYISCSGKKNATQHFCQYLQTGRSDLYEIWNLSSWQRRGPPQNFCKDLCTYAYARSENMRVLVKMCAHTFMLLRTCFYMKLYDSPLLCHDLIFRISERFAVLLLRYSQSNVEHAHKRHECKCKGSPHPHARFRFVCAHLCTDLFQIFLDIGKMLRCFFCRYWYIDIRYVSGISEVYCMCISDIFHIYQRNIFEAYLRCISTISQPYFGHISGIFYKYLKHI